MKNNNMVTKYEHPDALIQVIFSTDVFVCVLLIDRYSSSIWSGYVYSFIINKSDKLYPDSSLNEHPLEPIDSTKNHVHENIIEL